MEELHLPAPYQTGIDAKRSVSETLPAVTLDEQLAQVEDALLSDNTEPFSDLVAVYIKGSLDDSSVSSADLSSFQTIALDLIKLADDYASGELHMNRSLQSYTHEPRADRDLRPAYKVNTNVVSELYSQLVELVLQTSSNIPYAIGNPVSQSAATVLLANPVYRQHLSTDVPRRTDDLQRTAEDAAALLRDHYRLNHAPFPHFEGIEGISHQPYLH